MTKKLYLQSNRTCTLCFCSKQWTHTRKTITFVSVHVRFFCPLCQQASVSLFVSACEWLTVTCGHAESEVSGYLDRQNPPQSSRRHQSRTYIDRITQSAQPKLGTQTLALFANACYPHKCNSIGQQTNRFQYGGTPVVETCALKRRHRFRDAAAVDVRGAHCHAFSVSLRRTGRGHRHGVKIVELSTIGTS